MTKDFGHRPGTTDGSLRPPSFDVARLEREAPIDRVTFFSSVESTNSEALRAAAQQASAGGAVPGSELFLAETQTAGRGRGANQWWSAPGALTFSLLTAPLTIRPERAPLVSLAVGVAMCEAIETLAPGVQALLKWPNDVFLSGKKLCGVLIEMPPHRPPRLVIGVGLNVNNRLIDAPPEVRRRATSLSETAGDRPFDLTEVLLATLESIQSVLLRLERNDATLPIAWRNRSLLTGKRVRVELPGSELSGVCESIAPDGALLVRTAAGVEPCYGGVVAEFA
ncbi:MAG: biotin--[acetyl-CoA-carboxylase] ligase [Planctomycetota bacterium]